MNKTNLLDVFIAWHSKRPEIESDGLSHARRETSFAVFRDARTQRAWEAFRAGFEAGSVDTLKALAESDDSQPVVAACCEQCGSTDGVKFVEDPFAAEIRGDFTKHFLCPDCIQLSADEI